MKKTIFTLLLLCQAAALLAQPTFLDPGFGNAGKHVFTRPAYDEVHDVVVQPDGKILVAGTSIFRYSLVRYNADGTLDTGFGTGGMNYTFWLPDGISGEIRAVALQADGKIVALGTGGLVRYLPDGQPDFSFSPPDLQYDYHFALALAPDGKIVLGGYKYSGDAHFMIKRVRPDGTKDSSFGANGVASFNFGENTRALAIAVQPDGKTLAAGYSGSGDLLVPRLKANGAPDSTFNSTGALLIDGGAGSLSSNHISLLPDGKIMVGANGSGYISFFRINPDGSLDDTFGTGGEAKLPGFIYASDVEKAADGGFWMYCGKTGSGSVIVKVSATGEPDAGFADAGVLNVVGPYYDYALAVQADSNLVVATTTLGSDFTLSRYLPNGNIDSTFHHGAPVVTNIGQSGGEVNALAVQPDDGKVVGVGTGPGPMIIRLDSDGAPDSSFHARSAFISGESGGFNALLLQPDGKILAGGGIIYQDDNGIDFTEGVLYRFLSDGALDTSFSEKPVAFIKALARQPDGKFLAAGTDEGKIGHAYYIKPRLVRYLADGSVDSMFGAAGRKNTSGGRSR